MNKKLNKTLIIAEIGVNHNGSIKRAKSLALKAKNIGADIVKFQLYRTDLLATKNLSLCNYQSKFSKIKSSQYDLLKKYEISFSDALELVNFCKKNFIQICFSCFDETSINIFNENYIKYIKIPSGEINNYILLTKLSKFRKKFILSVGNSNYREINNAINILNNNFKKNIIILHCVSDYPAKESEMNLKTIPFLKKKFKTEIGLSDHSTSIFVPSLAVALGAKVVEKHITDNNNLIGPDHKSSLNIQDFKKMITNLRNTEKILGIEGKIISKSELKNKKLVRRFIVAKNKIKKGEKFSEMNVTTKRTGKGIPANFYFKIIGKRAKKSFMNDELIIT